METIVTLQSTVDLRDNGGPLGPCGTKATWNRSGWASWGSGDLTGLADHGMLSAASHKPLENWGSVLSFLWKRTVSLSW